MGIKEEKSDLFILHNFIKVLMEDTKDIFSDNLGILVYIDRVDGSFEFVFNIPSTPFFIKSGTNSSYLDSSRFIHVYNKFKKEVEIVLKEKNIL